MGKIGKEKKVKLIIGMLTKDEQLFEETEDILKRQFKKIELASCIFAFDETEYYKEEFGEGLKRKFISFKKLILEGSISKIKVYTNSIEEKFSLSGKRRINIDPGYIGSGKLVLASTKDSYHRVYLNNGIYGECTLYFYKGEFREFPWTYPDFRKEEYKNFFLSVRKAYLKN
ncbi:MAG: DUF4416 family protein [bacterium]